MFLSQKGAWKANSELLKESVGRHGIGGGVAYEPLGNGCLALLAPCALQTVVHFAQLKTFLYSKYIKNPLPLYKLSPAKE